MKGLGQVAKSTEVTVPVDADSSRARAEIQSVAQAARSVDDAKVTIYSSVAAAMTGLRQVEDFADKLDDKKSTVTVDADTGRARYELQKVHGRLFRHTEKDSTHLLKVLGHGTSPEDVWAAR